MNDWQDGSLCVLVGDCRERLRELPDASVDALVTDPPAGISFMGREWDTSRRDGGRLATHSQTAALGRASRPGRSIGQAGAMASLTS